MIVTAPIRRSQEQDANSIHDLVRDIHPLTPHTRYTYWNLFRNFGNACFIAEDQDRPVGFITSHPTTTSPKEWFIWQAGILPDYRGTGLIDRLQDRVIEVARDYGALALTTSIEADNPRSLGAFSRLATRLHTTLEEVERFNLTPDDPQTLPEVLYRIPLNVVAPDPELHERLRVFGNTYLGSPNTVPE